MTYKEYKASEWCRTEYKPKNMSHREWLEYLNSVWAPLREHTITTYLLLFKGNWNRPVGTYIKLNPNLFIP